jgi:ABC-type nickel/cobalt efflux system permease component RcnA
VTGLRRLVVIGSLAVGSVTVVVAVPAAPASAHPLGNFTINSYSGLRVQPERVLIRLVTDMAEIPTFQSRSDFDTDRNGRTDAAETRAYRDRACARQAANVALRVDGTAAPIRVQGGALRFPTGQGGLATLRLSCDLVAATAAVRDKHRIEYRNSNFDDRVGWREITAVGDGATITYSTVPRASVSRELTAYPKDLLRSPPDQRSASLRTRPGGPRYTGPAARFVAPTAALPRGVDRATRSFTNLVARRDVSLGFGLVAFALAIALGGVHALAPGHGKTVMAAYLIGQRGSLRQAALVGLTVTVTHTLGVMVLGLVLSTGALIAPERLYPWLGLASGLLLAGVGAGLLTRAIRARRARGHARGSAHLHGHTHSHSGHSHPPLDAERPMHWRGLVAMGFAGGMVPAPSALVVLLGAIALGRAWFGAVLVVAYGLGMAVTLTTAGLLLVRARGALDRRAAQGARSAGPARAVALAQLLPLATSSLIVFVGLFLAARAAIRV